MATTLIARKRSGKALALILMSLEQLQTKLREIDAPAQTSVLILFDRSSSSSVELTTGTQH